MILRRSTAEMDTNVDTLPTTESNAARKGHCQRCGLLERRATGSWRGSEYVQCAFRQHVLGPTEYIDTKYWQQPEIEGVRPKHN